MKLTTRTSTGRKLTIKEMDTNLTYLESISGNSSDPVYYAINKYCTSAILNVNNSSIGFNLINKDKFLKPDNGLYIFSTVETYLKFNEAVVNGYPGPDDQRVTSINLFSSVETYLKFAEAMSNWFEFSAAVGTTNNGFNTQLKSLLENPLINYQGETLPTRFNNIDMILDRGIVEVNGIENKSILDRILDNLDMYSVNSTPDILKFIQDYTEDYSITPLVLGSFIDSGLVVWENTKYISISNIEEILKYLESFNPVA